jgi:hypothetical protein
VVARYRQRIGQAAKHAGVEVMHRRSLAVHQFPRADDLAAKGRADALVAKTDAKQRHLAGEGLDRRHRNAGLGGRAGAGRNDDARRPQRGDCVDGDFVVAKHLDLFAQLAEILHQVVGEAVVVVDHQQHVAAILLFFKAVVPDNPS